MWKGLRELTTYSSWFLNLIFQFMVLILKFLAHTEGSECYSFFLCQTKNICKKPEVKNHNLGTIYKLFHFTCWTSFCLMPVRFLYCYSLFVHPAFQKLFCHFIQHLSFSFQHIAYSFLFGEPDLCPTEFCVRHWMTPAESNLENGGNIRASISTNDIPLPK